jgi:hypothetical protein
MIEIIVQIVWAGLGIYFTYVGYGYVKSDKITLKNLNTHRVVSLDIFLLGITLLLILVYKIFACGLICIP